MSRIITLISLFLAFQSVFCQNKYTPKQRKKISPFLNAPGGSQSLHLKGLIREIIVTENDVTTVYKYDLLGNLLSVEFSNSIYSFNYDEFKNLVSEYQILKNDETFDTTKELHYRYKNDNQKIEELQFQKNHFGYPKKINFEYNLEGKIIKEWHTKKQRYSSTSFDGNKTLWKEWIYDGPDSNFTVLTFYSNGDTSVQKIKRNYIGGNAIDNRLLSPQWQKQFDSTGNVIQFIGPANKEGYRRKYDYKIKYYNENTFLQDSINYSVPIDNRAKNRWLMADKINTR